MQIAFARRHLHEPFLKPSITFDLRQPILKLPTISLEHNIFTNAHVPSTPYKTHNFAKHASLLGFPFKTPQISEGCSHAKQFNWAFRKNPKPNGCVYSHKKAEPCQLVGQLHNRLTQASQNPHRVEPTWSEKPKIGCFLWVSVETTPKRALPC